MHYRIVFKLCMHDIMNAFSHLRESHSQISIALGNIALLILCTKSMAKLIPEKYS